MADFGKTLLLLICAQFALPMETKSWLSTFENASALSYLTNQLPNFDKPQCEKSENEIYLNFSNVGFKVIGTHFIDSLYVTCLSLDNNEITRISEEAFDRLPNLHFLDLSGNQIRENEFSGFSGLDNLKTLALDNFFPSSNEETHEDPIPIDYSRHYRRPFSRPHSSPYSYQEKQNRILEIPLLPNLETLYLRRNNLKSFSSSLQESTPRLTNLHLSGNHIGEPSSLSLMFDMFPPNLTHLSLDENSIHELNGQRLKNLVYVNLSGNKIKYVCNKNFRYSSLSLQKATRLQYLLLSHNEITDVDKDAFDDASNLLHLDLSHNKIQSFRNGTFGPLANLREFVANSNLLYSVPNIGTAVSLRNVTLSDNQITSIPNDAFSNLRLLRILRLDGNRITSIAEDAFSSLSSLEYLDLSGNMLWHLPANWMLPLENLRVLLMMSNRFTDFDDLNLKNATSLTELHVENNAITRLNTRVFAELPTNISVHLQNVNCKMLDSVEPSTMTPSPPLQTADYYYS